MESLWGAVQTLWSGVIEALTHVVTPDWAALIGLLPIGILLGVVVFFAWIVVRYATAAEAIEGVRWLREDFKSQGETATTRRVQNAGGFPTKEQFDLFPKKPAKKMAYIAGLPKPHGCV